MFEVSVTNKFVAAHQLRAPAGPAETLHEHAWRVTVTYAGHTLDETGVLVDFRRLQSGLDELLAALDGRNLNDLPVFAKRKPSAENVAHHLAEQLAREHVGPVWLRCVEVEEEPGCVARYLPPVERGEIANG